MSKEEKQQIIWYYNIYLKKIQPSFNSRLLDKERFEQINFKKLY